MEHVYDATFFDYIEKGSRASARVIIPLLKEELRIESVLDVGCGRGAWLKEWQASGVQDFLGLDGTYVDTSNLLIPADRFRTADLTAPFNQNRQFSVAQCLEVAEHLPEKVSEQLVASLVRHSSVVVFSAATPGQGGEHHVNEKPLEFWRTILGRHGMTAFDVVRAKLEKLPAEEARNVEPWYRFNTVVYVNEVAEPQLGRRLDSYRVPAGQELKDGGNWPWRLRKAAVRMLPFEVREAVARLNAQRVARLAQRSRR